MPSKEIERDYLLRFATARPDLAICDVRDSERPDFLFTRDNRLVGIEVTRYSPARHSSGFIAEEQESLRSRILTLARAAYETSGGEPLHVQALFNDHRPLRAHRTASLAAELSDYLLQGAAGVPLYAKVPFSPSVKHPYMIEIGSVSAHRVPSSAHGIWYAGSAGWVRGARPEEIARILSEKESKLPEYRLNCQETWLLIVFDTLPGGEYVQGPAQNQRLDFATAFDRVFTLERVTKRCIELPVRRAA